MLGHNIRLAWKSLRRNPVLTLLIVSGIMLAITQILEVTRISRDTIHNVQETQLAGPAISSSSSLS